MAFKDWVRLPTRWIQDGGLRSFRWSPTEGASHAAALMTLVALAHHADDQTMSAAITYDQLTASTTLSRAKVSAGLKMLEAQRIIVRKTNGRSSFQITGYDPTKDWGKLPARAALLVGIHRVFQRAEPEKAGGAARPEALPSVRGPARKRQQSRQYQLR